MIKNIVFDLGQVLLHFDPKTYVYSLYDNIKADHLLHQLFLSQYWLDLDRGTIEYEEVLQQLIECEPELADEYTYLINHWIGILSPIQKHVDLLSKLKMEGYRVYYCSNFQRDSFLSTYAKYDFFTLFDGGVVSYQNKSMKPEPQIYQSLLEQYGLKAEECLFIDDALKNVEGALDLGFHAIHCTPEIDLERELRNMLLEVNHDSHFSAPING